MKLSMKKEKYGLIYAGENRCILCSQDCCMKWWQIINIVSEQADLAAAIAEAFLEAGSWWLKSVRGWARPWLICSGHRMGQNPTRKSGDNHQNQSFAAANH
jgi:hypothetical protein